MIPSPPIWVLDTECYRNFFLVMLKNIHSGQILYWESYPGKESDVNVLADLLSLKQIVTFNGINYDLPMMTVALTGASNETLKTVSDAVIVAGLKPWHISERFGGVDLSAIDHIDLIEVAPGLSGLKIYGGRLHSKRLQDLPIEPGETITPEQRKVLIEYCGNDLQTTIDLYHKLEPQLALRREMSAEFGIDLRSKSDAQIAEAVIRKEVEKRVGHRVYRPDIHPAYTFKYRPPAWVSFQTPGMQQLMRVIDGCTFSLSSDGSVEMPRVLQDMRIRIGDGVYRMGIGGLHSSESSVAHHATESVRIVDRDVTSYYPSIILNESLYPAHLGPAFLEVYRGLVERRVHAKHAGLKVMSDALKICVNGSFGKLGSRWSVLYSPDLLIQVTLTGQIALLMLIEALEEAGIKVLSANTDGVVSILPKQDTAQFEFVLSMWETMTGFNTEETEYSHLYASNVNNYIAIKPGGETKLKGLYAPAGLQKNTTNEICVEAVIAKLTQDIDVRLTIGACHDIRKFVTIRKVNGGAKYGGEFLGKAVRWYYAKDEIRHIEYATNGNMVARSKGARPVMELPDRLPQDINYDWYVAEAESILSDVGAV